jgi:hypothetical protein
VNISKNPRYQRPNKKNHNLPASGQYRPKQKSTIGSFPLSKPFTVILYWPNFGKPITQPNNYSTNQ